MSWLCPQCRRAFKHKNQAHSCVKVNIADMFTNKSPLTLFLYEKLKEKALKLGDVKIHSSRSMINFTGGGTFMVVKPKRDWLDIEIIANEEIIVSPVYKSIQFSKNRFALFAKIQNEDDISPRLMRMLEKGFELSIK